MNRNERRSWRLHCAVAEKFNNRELLAVFPSLLAQAALVSEKVQGEPHVSNVYEWTQILRSGNVAELRPVLVGEDRHSIEMREVSALTHGLLTEAERRSALEQ